MKRKHLAALMAGVLMLSLTACGGASDSGGAGTAATSAASSEGSEMVSEAAAGTEKETFKVTFLKNEWHGDPNDMEIFDKLEEMANVDVEWQVYSNATWPDKKNLVLASGELPDVFYMNAVSLDDINKYASQGMFLDLTDLIEQYCPNLQAAFERMPELKNVCVNPEDGKIYTVARGAAREVQDTKGILYINKKWLDQLGMELPDTIDDFYEALKAFRDNDMNGNGDSSDELPFIFHYSESKPDQAYSYHELFGSFGYADYVNEGTNRYGDHFILDEKTGEIVYVAETEEYKNAIQYFHKCVEEGLWDSEGFTTLDTSVMNAKGHNDPEIVGSFVAFDSTFVVPEEYLADYVPLKPLAGPDGDRVWLKNSAANQNINGTQFVLTEHAKGKEAAIMRWLDAHFDPEISVELFLGTIGTTLVRTDSGMIDYVPTPEGMSYSEFRYGNAPVHVPCIIAAEDWGTFIQVMDEDVNKLQIAKDYLKPYQTQSSLLLLPNASETEFFLGIGEDIVSYVNKMQVKWLTEGGIENEWDDYLKQLETLGLEEYKSVITGIHQRMLEE